MASMWIAVIEADWQKTERHTVRMGEVIEGFRDRWAAIMKVSA
jgi:hypothetical protein